VSEGTTSAAVSFSNVSGGAGGYTYSYDFNDSGTFEITNSSNASVTIPESYLDDGPSTDVVRGRITDSSGNYKDFTTSITVNNVAPTPSINPPSSPVMGIAATFTASATDPSTADTKAGFTYAWNFGDSGTGSGASISHTYAAAGTYTVTLTATDKDGGSKSTTTSVTVGSSGSGSGENHNPFITTPWDNIPNFGQSPNIYSSQSGNWSSPSTWSLGRVPQAGDVVSIDPGITVTYDANSTAAVTTVIVQNGGTLNFNTTINTELMVTNLLVLQGGDLQIGTASSPEAAGVTAQIVFNNVALNTSTDPSQYGNGLIDLGTVNIHGASKNQTFLNLAKEAHAGDTTLTLAAPATGWQVGDQIYLPDTTEGDCNQTSSYQLEDETDTIASISANGTVITLSSALQYNHLGGYDGNGVLQELPSVADLTRNVSIHSQSATGTRGYAMFTYRANVDIEYAMFGGMGRTTDAQTDDTTYDSNGNVTHVGSNQENRNAVTFLHLIGQTTPQSDGYQYTFIGNTVRCPLNPMPFRWGINLYDSDYGLIQDNVVENWAGAGIVCATGSEIDNVINDNYVSNITADGAGRDDTRNMQDFGFDGAAFWFRGFNNVVTNNVASDAAYGYDYFANSAPNTVMVPPAQGADPSTYVSEGLQSTPILQFSNNEIFGQTGVGMTIWALGAGYTGVVANMPTSTIKNLTAWNVGMGYYGYEASNVTFDGFTAYDNASLLSNSNNFQQGIYFSDYLTNNFTLTNSNIQGFRQGMLCPSYGMGTITISNCTFNNCQDIVVQTPGAPGSNTNSTTMPASTTLIKNDVLNLLTSNVGGTPEYTVWMDYMAISSTVANLIVSQTVYVTNYNDVSGDNFQVYYNQQAASYVIPQTSSDGVSLIGAPVAGLTNQQAWAKYGIAIAGAVAPATAKAMANIYGLVN
jgi:hypothetical protein